MLKTPLAVLVIVVSFAGLLAAQAVEVNFRGSVESLPASGLTGEWKVAGRTVKVTTSTSIDQERGPVTTGSCVEVKGTQNSDNSVQASAIEVKAGMGGCSMAPGRPDENMEFRGVVQAKPGTGTQGVWQVSGRKVEVSGSTQILPVGNAPAVGACVLVRGNVQATGNIAADRIQGQGQGACDQGPNERDEPKLIGKIETLPAGGALIGDWKVAGNTVRVSRPRPSSTPTTVPSRWAAAWRFAAPATPLSSFWQCVSRQSRPRNATVAASSSAASSNRCPPAVWSVCGRSVPTTFRPPVPRSSIRKAASLKLERASKCEPRNRPRAPW